MYQVYAFLTLAGWQQLAAEQWPHAVDVGSNYKLIVFTNEQEPKLEALAISHGFKVKRLTAVRTINAMAASAVGPFVCSYDIAQKVVQHFSPIEVE
ncbi:TPA: hypothetical protein RUZ39_001680 [Vibrio cholerae]|nr:hypothetical protein [Vibrio cholerae]